MKALSTLGILAVLALLLLIFAGRSLDARADGPGCSQSFRARGKLTASQSVTEAELNQLSKQFLDYCLSTPALRGDERVRKLSSTWNKAILLSDFPGETENVLGSFNVLSGCLYMRDMTNKPASEQLGILLHELAHCQGTGHDDVWRDCFLFFVNIATQKLGWEVTLKCPTVCKSYNICSKQNCEFCDWLNPDLCKK